MLKPLQILWFSFGLVLLILILHLMSGVGGWYNRFVWPSPVMHFLGGFWAMSLTIWLFWRRHRLVPAGGLTWRLLIVILAIGLVWEIFEYLIGESQAHASYYLYYWDTAFDLTSDLAGGLAGLATFNKLYRAYAEPA